MNKNDFIVWLDKKGHSSSVKSNYPLYLEKYIPKILKEEFTEESKDLFGMQQVDEVKKILNLFIRNSDLKKYNKEKSSFPTSSMRKYIDFLNDKKDRRIKVKNLMLYGAPGVGKTYNYKNLITMIESGNKDIKEILKTIESEEDSPLENKVFDLIKDERRVEFVTFHQSYSYEDFIEGYRPNKDNGIQLEDGIFKNICEKAINNSNKSTATEKLVFSDALDILLSASIENEEMVKINLKRDNSYFEIYDYDEKSIFYTRQGRGPNEKYHTLSISTLSTMYSDEKNNFVVGGLKTYYNPLLETLLKIGKENKVESVDKKNFYIIIDEINRGNISKIFGELITLIEEDKRDNYEVTLPYSKNQFKIPSNLYIIATMNSTDKSIATIDIALRRRFTFIKMKPKETLVKNMEARELMHKLNEFIEKFLGEDNKLGHSYFMGDNIDLEFIKEYKIKPLLEEYFYADDDRLEKVLDLLYKKEK